MDNKKAVEVKVNTEIDRSELDQLIAKIERATGLFKEASSILQELTNEETTINVSIKTERE